MATFGVTLCLGAIDVRVERWGGAPEARAAFRSQITLWNETSPGDGPVYSFAEVGWVSDPESGSAVGIVMDSEFEIPTVLGPNGGAAWWVGCNAHVYRVLPPIKIERQVELESRFSRFHRLPGAELLVVLMETGIVGLSEQGHIIWRVDLDVVTDTVWADRTVVVHQMDGPVVRIDLTNGSLEDL